MREDVRVILVGKNCTHWCKLEQQRLFTIFTSNQRYSGAGFFYTSMWPTRNNDIYGTDFIRAKINGVRICSCFLPLSVTIEGR